MTMTKTDQWGWRRLLEGVRRGDVTPLDQENVVEGADCCRVYMLRGEVVACMRVSDSNTDKAAQDCVRVFDVAPELLKATAHVYIPTDEEYEAVGEEEDATGTELLTAYIAKREAELR